MLVQVDNPSATEATLVWLREQQLRRLDSMRVRLASTNEGAAAARNRLLDEAWPCDLVIFWDDDVLPSPACVDAYVDACRAHPEAAGFAGPTFLPRCPRLLPTAIHMSDVSFFWEAPLTLYDQGHTHVPWAVTANCAFRKTALRFREGFPKTGMLCQQLQRTGRPVSPRSPPTEDWLAAGGGEDVDFCLQVASHRGLLAVPEASAVHPWWPERRPWVGVVSSAAYLRASHWSVLDAACRPLSCGGPCRSTGASGGGLKAMAGWWTSGPSTATAGHPTQ